MADIAPLTPLRFSPALARDLSQVVAPPYDVIGGDERADLCARHPHNVVRLILPEGEGDTKYENAAALLRAWRQDGVLVRDDQPAFYRYDQTFSPPGQPGRGRLRRRGFLGLVRIRPFEAGIVLPHERTLSGPREDRFRLFSATRTNLSPGFMLYRDPERALDACLEEAEVLAEFSTPDGVTHSLAKVASPERVQSIVRGLVGSTLLIADGHHRYETALRYERTVDETRAARGEPIAPGRAEHRWFMSFLANGDDPNLMVFPTHRHVHSMGAPAVEAFMKGAPEFFDVLPLPSRADAATLTDALAQRAEPAVAVALPDGRAFVLAWRSRADGSRHPTLGKLPEVLRRTDVAVLHAAVLEHLLGITPEAQAAKTNLWYPQDAAAAISELRAGRGDVLFLMRPTPVEQVRGVAETGHVMPQKSTFFYPKVLTGLAVHTLEPERLVAWQAGADA